jgi:hypothetical protein
VGHAREVAFALPRSSTLAAHPATHNQPSTYLQLTCDIRTFAPWTGGHVGSSALEGLLATSTAVSTLCAANVWQCEGEKVLAGVKACATPLASQSTHTSCTASYSVDASAKHSPVLTPPTRQVQPPFAVVSTHPSRIAPHSVEPSTMLGFLLTPLIRQVKPPTHSPHPPRTAANSLTPPTTNSS